MDKVITTINHHSIPNVMVYLLNPIVTCISCVLSYMVICHCGRCDLTSCDLTMELYFVMICHVLFLDVSSVTRWYLRTIFQWFLFVCESMSRRCIVTISIRVNNIYWLTSGKSELHFGKKTVLVLLSHFLC
jgi:hypothetical protein